MALKGLSFGNVDSLDYGVGITGSGVYSAPERDVETIEIQGRNGNYILDNGRFRNIEVVYPAVMGDVTQTDFAEKISDFRNAMFSQYGYQRLEDDYNPDEFRLGALVGGLDVKPDANSMASDFELKFDCKPQRFLKSGETAVSVASGGTITNPTAFPSSPLLLVEGHGSIGINDETIVLNDTYVGTLVLTNGGTKPIYPTVDTTFQYDSSAPYNSGDEITCSSIAWYFHAKLEQGYPTNAIRATATVTSLDGLSNVNITVGRWSETASTPMKVLLKVTATIENRGYTSAEYTTPSCYISVNVIMPSGSTSTTVVYHCIFPTDLLRTSMSVRTPEVFDNATPTPQEIEVVKTSVTLGVVTVDSTVSALGHPNYIDLEVGEAYMISNGSKISLNNVAILGAELPVLQSGNNSITYDDTVTDFKIVPRWWNI